MILQEKIKVYNSLSGKIENFLPIKAGEVKIYACGVTVYDELHLGHARQAIVFDVIRNYFEFLGYNVIYVRNYTDVDDKIIKKAEAENKSMGEISSYYIKESEQDLKKLKVRPATYEPKVTEHINDIIKYIEILIQKGFAYEKNGEVFFEVNKFKNYGKLSKRKVEDLLSAEINSNKRNPEDFSLWKPAKQGEPKWKSPWREGRPGWHIECSVMANKYLGPSIDIHGGGLDLIFPHHENEIAQSEAYSDCVFAHYWVHNGLIMVDGKKMSKSLGNFITIKDILKNYHPDIVRFAVLFYSYNSAVDFSDALLSNASKRVYYFYKTLNSISSLVEKNKHSNWDGELPDFVGGMVQNFQDEMDNNFNTAKVIASLSNIFSFINNFIIDKNVDEKEKVFVLSSFLSKFKVISEVLKIFDENPNDFVKSFKLEFIKKEGITSKIINVKIKERELAKKRLDYIAADKIRDDLFQRKISVQDFENTTSWDIILD